MCFGSTEEEAFWDMTGAATALLTSEQPVLTLSLQFNDLKRSLSSLTLLFVSSLVAGDVSTGVLADAHSLSETSLFKAPVLVLLLSDLSQVLLLMASCSRLHLCSET